MIREVVGLLAEAVSLLDAQSDTFEFQLGGARNFGAGIADVDVLNPLYTDKEIRRVYHRAREPTTAMQEKDDRWPEYREEFTRALQACVSDADDELATSTDRQASMDEGEWGDR